MSASAKIVSFAILTYFLFGFSSLMQQGVFIVPFPMIPEFTLAMIFGISYNEFSATRKLSSPFVMLLVYGIIGVLSGQIFLEVAFSLERIILFHESGIIDVLKLIQIILLSTFLIIYAIGFELKWLTILLLILTVLGIAINFKLHELFSWFQVESDQLLSYGWFVALGITCVLSKKYKCEVEKRMLILTNFIVGWGIMHLLSIISITIY